MARPKSKSKLNKETSEVIEKAFLEENTDGLPKIKDPDQVVVAKYIPKMETIVFRNDRDPGQPLEFHYHSKTHYMKNYKLLHGHTYTLPVEIVEHLETRAIPIYGYRKGLDGHPEMFVNGYKHQFTCKTVRAA